MAPTRGAKKRNAAHRDDDQQPSRKKQNSAGSTSNTRPPRDHAQAQASDADSELEAPPYQRFEPTVLQVPRNIIDTSWTPLPAAVVEKITSILQTVERSVVMRLQDERKRDQASNAIDTVIRRLTRKITKGMPFPPSSIVRKEDKSTGEGRDADFDAEKVIDCTREGERKLTPLIHSVELLMSEIRKEEELLDQETKALERLERNAKADRARRRTEAKKFHPSLLVPEGGRREDEDLKLAEPGIEAAKLRKDEEDEDLRPVVRELDNHLDSMLNNFKQVRGIDEALNTAEAELKNSLLRQLGEEEYGQVMMG